MHCAVDAVDLSRVLWNDEAFDQAARAKEMALCIDPKTGGKIEMLRRTATHRDFLIRVSWSMALAPAPVIPKLVIPPPGGIHSAGIGLGMDGQRIAASAIGSAIAE